MSRTPRTVEDIEFAIASLIEANSNWASDPAVMRLYAALVEEKNQLKEAPPQQAGKYYCKRVKVC